MNNENIELSRYLLDEMTAEEKEAFEKELASREDWQAELSWLQDTVSLVKKHDVGDEVLSDESKARILAAASEEIQEAPASKPNVISFFTRLAVAAILMVGTAAAFLHFLPEYGGGDPGNTDSSSDREFLTAGMSGEETTKQIEDRSTTPGENDEDILLRDGDQLAFIKTDQGISREDVEHLSQLGYLRQDEMKTRLNELGYTGGEPPQDSTVMAVRGGSVESDRLKFPGSEEWAKVNGRGPQTKLGVQLGDQGQLGEQGSDQ